MKCVICPSSRPICRPDSLLRRLALWLRGRSTDRTAVSSPPNSPGRTPVGIFRSLSRGNRLVSAVTSSTYDRRRSETEESTVALLSLERAESFGERPEVVRDSHGRDALAGPPLFVRLTSGVDAVTGQFVQFIPSGRLTGPRTISARANRRPRLLFALTLQQPLGGREGPRSAGTSTNTRTRSLVPRSITNESIVLSLLAWLARLFERHFLLFFTPSSTASGLETVVLDYRPLQIVAAGFRKTST